MQHRHEWHAIQMGAAPMYLCRTCRMVRPAWVIEGSPRQRRNIVKPKTAK